MSLVSVIIYRVRYSLKARAAITQIPIHGPPLDRLSTDFRPFYIIIFDTIYAED